MTVFDNVYTHGGVERWDLGWATPNYGGAFVATVLPWVWALSYIIASAMDRRCYGVDTSEARWGWRAGRSGFLVTVVLLLLVELLGYYALVRTQSRGAVIAVFSAGLYMAWAKRPLASQLLKWLWLIRAALLLTLIVLTGFLGRIAPALELRDASVTNRLHLWESALAMIAILPVEGWGGGESGRAYMNWFQDPQAGEAYSTTVSSYLHVGVEYGLWCLGLSVALIFVAVGLCAKIAKNLAGAGDAGEHKEASVIAACMGSVLLAWAVSNAFSTLWMEPFLWVVPLGSVVASLSAYGKVFAIGGSGEALKALVKVMIGIVAVASGVTAAGWLVEANSEVKVLVKGDVVYLQGGGQKPGSVPFDSVVHVWPDRQVLGEVPGREVRLWLRAIEGPVQFAVHHESVQATALPTGSIVVLFGRAAEELPAAAVARVRRLWIVHPTVPPDVHNRGSLDEGVDLVLILPEVDQLGIGKAWREWAKHMDAHVDISDNCGTDIRSAWPSMAPLVYQPMKRTGYTEGKI